MTSDGGLILSRYRAGSTAIAVAKSEAGGRRVGAVSEKSIPRQQAALVGGIKTSRWNPATSLGPALVGNSLCPSQEEHTIRETEVQIGNSGIGVGL